MESKRKLLSITEEDFKLLASLRTDEKTFVEILRQALKSAVVLKWAETHEPDLYFQIIKKYKEFINSQNQKSQTSQQVQQQPSQSEPTQS
jgi:flagellar biosynthesis component FlhA